MATLDYRTPQTVQPGHTFLGHPIGLFLLFLVEMWERFSYYGMRALLVLYLVSPTSGMHNPPAGVAPGFNPGRGWTDASASTLYGWYTGLAYLLPIFGGIIADKLIGTHRSMIVGALLISLGHVTLAISGMGSLGQNDLGMSIFIMGLALIVLGTGHFKPTVSVMVGQLYAPEDPRREGAFSIFYMGINLGAFLCAFVCGTLGERVGWHWGFGAAAVGMLAGLLLYSIGRPKFLAGIGEPPAGMPNIAPYFILASIVLSAAFAFLYHWQAFSSLGKLMQTAATSKFSVGQLAVGAISMAVIALAVWFVIIQQPGDRGPVTAIFLFMFFNVFFWIAFEQAGSSINLFTDRFTQRQLGSWTVPTTWFQSANPLMIITLAPIFGATWVGLARRNLNPSQPAKIALGLIFLGIGYLFITWGAISTKAGVPGVTSAAKASMLFILATYLFHTMGELCLSPTGLSFVTRVAPVRFVSLLMGIWFISSFIANLCGGLIAARVEAIEKGEVSLPWHIGGQADFFMLFVVSSLGAGFLVLIFTPLLKRLIAGRE
ncbi:MAG: peptide MFS transporter [Bacillota bacterium]